MFLVRGEIYLTRERPQINSYVKIWKLQTIIIVGVYIENKKINKVINKLLAFFYSLSTLAIHLEVACALSMPFALYFLTLKITS